jgi:hypothetical protein
MDQCLCNTFETEPKSVAFQSGKWKWQSIYVCRTTFRTKIYFPLFNQYWSRVACWTYPIVWFVRILFRLNNDALSSAEVIYNEMGRLLWVVSRLHENLEEGNRSIVPGTIPTFSCRYWGILQRTSVWIIGDKARFEPGTSMIHVTYYYCTNLFGDGCILQ